MKEARRGSGTQPVSRHRDPAMCILRDSWVQADLVSEPGDSRQRLVDLWFKSPACSCTGCIVVRGKGWRGFRGRVGMRGLRTSLVYAMYNNNNNVHLSRSHQRPERSRDTY